MNKDVTCTFYEENPYPLIREFSNFPNIPASVLALNYDFSFCGSIPFPDDFKIWIPGCGTVQAISTALKYKKASIFATDISDTSLKITESLAKKLNLQNITFHKQNIMDNDYWDTFDFISCYGVLHHMKDPLRGLRILRRALKQNGVMELMLYNLQHRRQNQIFQKIVQIFSGKDASLTKKSKIAQKLMFSVIQSPNCRPLNRYLKDIKANRMIENDYPTFLDTFVHPKEVALDIYQLFKWLDKTNLRILKFFNEPRWNLSFYIQDKELSTLFNELSSLDRYQLINLLGGEFSPMFDFYVVRDYAENFIRHCDQNRNLFLQIIPMNLKPDKRYVIQQNSIVIRKARQQLIKRKNGIYCFTSGNGEMYTLPETVSDLLRLCDGKQNINEIIDRYCSLKRYNREENEQAIMDLFKVLMLSPFRLLVPYQCPDCKLDINSTQWKK